MNRVAHQLLQWWPSALVVAVIIYATWLPDPVGAEELPKIPHLDKLIHAVMMGGLASALMFDSTGPVPDGARSRAASSSLSPSWAWLSAWLTRPSRAFFR